MIDAIFKRISKMSYKRLYTTVKAHLLKQNKRASNGYGTCYYKKDDLKCAVGCLIPDNLYTKELEGKPVTVLAQISRVKLSLAKQDMLKEFQIIHDWHNVADWGELIDKVYAKYS